MDLDPPAASRAIAPTTGLDVPLLSAEVQHNIQAPGRALYRAFQGTPYYDIDDQLRLIQLERCEIELWARKKQLQHQADSDIVQKSSASLFSFTYDTKPLDMIERGPVHTEFNGVMNLNAVNSSLVLDNIHPDGQGISQTSDQPSIFPLDSDITCLPPAAFSLKSNDPFPLALVHKQNKLSTEPIPGKVLELSEKEAIRSSSDQALRPSPISLQDKTTKPQSQHLSRSLAVRTRNKKKRPDIPGSLCFQLNDATGRPARTKQVRSKETLERTKAIRKVGSCLYCRYLKKPVCY